MKAKNFSERAFPSYDLKEAVCNESRQGMGLRDYLAAHVISGIPCRSWDHIANDQKKIEAWANLAYATADAMLKAREA